MKLSLNIWRDKLICGFWIRLLCVALVYKTSKFTRRLVWASNKKYADHKNCMKMRWTSLHVQIESGWPKLEARVSQRTSPLDLDGLVYGGNLGLLFQIFIIVATLNCMSKGTSCKHKEAILMVKSLRVGLEDDSLCIIPGSATDYLCGPGQVT